MTRFVFLSFFCLLLVSPAAQALPLSNDPCALSTSLPVELEPIAPLILLGAIGRFIKKFKNMMWERRLGISTRGIVYEGPRDDAYYYATEPYAPIFTILRGLKLNGDDVFVDIGCGKGRVVCCAAQFPVREVIGVEISPDLSAIARSNAERLKVKNAPVTIKNISATDFDYRDGTVFFLFNPFGEMTLKDVLSRMEAALPERKNGLRLVYVHPRHEFVMAGCGWLKQYDYWDEKTHPVLEHAVSFWKSVPPTG